MTVEVEAIDHFIRIVIFSVTLLMAIYINRIYLMRLAENEDQIKLQRIISQISANFVTVTASNLDDKINGMLKQIGDYSQVDRTYLFHFSKDLKTATYTHGWRNNCIESEMGFVKEVSAAFFPWWMDQMLNNGVVHVPVVEELPLEAAAEKKMLQAQQIKSLISIPVTKNDKVLGFLGFDAVIKNKNWKENHQELLKVLANILADALVKVEAEKEINYMAYYDGLTGLPNRTLFKNRLEQAIHLARRSEKLIGVLFIDLDSFKAVNDTMGHKGGDDLLKQVAKKLTHLVRQYDTVSRFGGDEFLIMIPQFTSIEDIQKVAQAIMKAFYTPMTVNDQEFYITASTGIAIYPVDGEDADTLIKNADMAMYASKDGGKNQYTLCTPVMKEDILKKMQMTNSLYRALDRNELVLYYQPQINIATKEIIGLEALIRWKHPHLGMISPATFIPLAEQTGLINPIGQWVLQTACRQNKSWQDMGFAPIRIAVNLSVEQFRSPNLAGIVSSTLRETGLPPEYLELEITESIAIKEANYIIHMLNDLKSIGVTISIDDFGTEYSSLSRLKELPIDRIKMAMQFVQGISTNNKDEAIIEVIIHLAKSLGLKIIAEGVETELQVAFLAQAACDEIQGYYYYKPMLAEEVELILS
ncbi:MAG: EAL domain-containing protein [Verrucomicrobia bacterium]|nr:EAL domain-containing protein [Prolixibacteraceae bacterium]